MDKKTWVENKVAKLIEEGKTQDEAIAIANSMWEDEYGNAADKALEVQSEVRQAMPALTEAAEKSLFERIWDGIQQRLGSKDADETTGFKVLGNQWWATWSNNFKDRDGEIFTSKAILDYVARVDMGVVPMPRLWIWHGGKQVDVGAAKMVGFDGHFTHASGEFDSHEGAQLSKNYYAKHAKDTGISHGYMFPRNKFDGKFYHEFNTFEISLLPRGSEANWYTSIQGVKEMALDEKKQQYLKEVFGEEHAARILSDWDKRGKALEALEVEYKDFSGTDTTPVEANKQALANADKAFRDLLPDLMEGSAEAVTAALEAVKASKATDSKVAALEKQIDALRAEMQLAPRSVTQGGGAVLDPESAAGKALLETVQAGLVEIDPLFKVAVRKPV